MEISTEQRQFFSTFINAFNSNTRIPKKNAWLNWDDEKIWFRCLSQVIVVGNEKPKIRIFQSDRSREVLSIKFLSKLDSTDLVSKIINSVFTEAGVRWVSSTELESRKSIACAKNFYLLTKTYASPKSYFIYLASIKDEYQRVLRVMKDFSYIKSKGARDFLIEAGMAIDFIAFDARIVNIFNKIDFYYPEKFTSRERSYREVEIYLVQNVCKPLGITGAQFDRIMFNNYDKIQQFI